MKTIALSTLFSLAVILCEQQTLFAPHITTFEGLTAANPLTNGRCLQRRIVGGTMCSAFADDSPPNSLVPIAGVNRLIPVAGANSFNVSKAHYSTQNPTHKENDPAAVDLLQTKDGVSMYDHIRGEEDQSFDYDLGPMDIGGGSWSMFSRGLH
jgi:hypothetical protein